MPRPKKTTEEKIEEPKTTKDITKIIVRISDRDVHGGIRHRTFTKAEHGEKFVELADTFCDTNKHSIIGKTFE